VLLVDIGNRYAHIYDGKSVVNLDYDELFTQYIDKKLYYINVNPKLVDRLSNMISWVNLEPYISLAGVYNGMGIDRQTLLLSRGDGLYIDAGSAITIDLKMGNRFIGGTILPGIWRVKECYSDISSKLSLDTLESVNLDILPNNKTSSSVSYGIIAPIISLIERINKESLPIYCCGGDGELLTSYLDAEYNSLMVFDGMKKVIKECEC